MSDQTHQPDFNARIAVLEERTKDKPKTMLDQLKAWGGILSLVIALAYSFPIGLWDRFIVTEQQKEAGQIAHLRNVVEQSTSLMIENGRAMSSIRDENLRDMVARAFNTRLFVIMTKNRDAFFKYKEQFTPPEALVIGFNFFMANQRNEAVEFYKLAADKAGQDVVTAVEAMRMHARALAVPGAGQDKAAARAVFANAHSKLKDLKDLYSINSQMTLLADWGLFEKMDGDWLCGEQKTREAADLYNSVAMLLADNGQFLVLLNAKNRMLSPRPDQPQLGCAASNI